MLTIKYLTRRSFLERLAATAACLRPIIPSASSKFFPFLRQQINSSEALYFEEIRIAMLVSFPKELLPAFWLHVKVSTTVPRYAISQYHSCLCTSSVTIHACPSLTGYQWSGTFGSHSCCQTHLLFPSYPHTGE